MATIVRDPAAVGLTLKTVDLDTEEVHLDMVIIDTITNRGYELPFHLSYKDAKDLAARLAGAVQFLSGAYLTDEEVLAELKEIEEQING